MENEKARRRRASGRRSAIPGGRGNLCIPVEEAEKPVKKADSSRPSAPGARALAFCYFRPGVPAQEERTEEKATGRLLLRLLLPWLLLQRLFLPWLLLLRKRKGAQAWAFP